MPKLYKKLQIPSTSAWDKKKFRLPWRIRRTIERIHNLIRWFPVIWKDHDWDGYYITKILQKKIEFQRSYIVKNNRHLDVDRDNKYMTIVLNLIERQHDNYYGIEYIDYLKELMNIDDETGLVSFETISDNSEAYFEKYKGALRRAMKENFFNITESDNRRKIILLCRYNEERSKKLLYKILCEHLNNWWD